MNINPNLNYKKIYTNIDIRERKRIVVTRFRLSAHRLKIGTGKWSRVPRDRRICQCSENQVQDEHHVVFNCKLSENLRRKYDINYHTLEQLFDKMSAVSVGKYLTELNKLYEEGNK